VNYAHTRAVQTRRWHCVEIKNAATPAPVHQLVILWQSATVGMATPANPCPDTTSWQRIQDLNIGPGTSVWDVQSVTHAAAGTTPANNAGLDSSVIVFKPDGTAVTGATVFIGDSTGARKDRVILYQQSGDAYPRKQW
jgi:hypothetical protein